MKRSVCLLVILSVCMILNPTISSAQQPKVFKLGFITSLSGTFAAVAETQKKGTLLLVDQINAKGGLNMPWGKVKIEVIIKDDEAKLDVGVRRFRELIAEGANGIIGTTWNPMAAAFNEECKITPVPFFPGCVPAIDSFKKGNMADCTFSVAFTPWSIGYLGGAIMSKNMGKKKIYSLSRSDSWGKTIRDGLAEALKVYGGEVIGVSESPQGTMDYTSAINKAKSMKPDVFYNDFFAGDSIASFKQAYELGLSKDATMFSAFITNVVGTGIPENALAGLYALNYYYYDLEKFEDKDVAKRAKEYTEAHMKKWGEPPDAYGTIAYVAGELMFKGVEKAGSFEAKKVSQAIMSAKDLTCVKGPVYFREDHQMVSKYAAFLVKGKEPREKKGKWDLFKVEGYFGGDAALPPLKMLGF
ncbi:MAG: ABC transporter substrate-binding protein [Deltaproteobacteria bacterium]|nr:ABC transporter substrate-binding protein [Deltaproteobacteria bacterium]